MTESTSETLMPAEPVVVIALRSITGIPTALIAVAFVFTLIYIRKLREAYLILIAAALGVLIKQLL
jgi:chromate transporter